jgi:hypothetical protein
MWKAAKKTQGQVRRELEQAINSFVRGTNAKNRRDASGQVRM